jgi:hypothetical protein
MAVIFSGIVQSKRNTQAYWTANPPDLLPGETVLETDTKRSKTNNTLSTVLNWVDITYDAVGPPGPRGLNALEEWLSRPENAGKDVENYDEERNGADGEDGVSVLILKSDVIPPGGVAVNAILFRVLP